MCPDVEPLGDRLLMQTLFQCQPWRCPLLRNMCRALHLGGDVGKIWQINVSPRHLLTPQQQETPFAMLRPPHTIRSEQREWLRAAWCACYALPYIPFVLQWQMNLGKVTVHHMYQLRPHNNTFFCQSAWEDEQLDEICSLLHLWISLTS